MNFKITVETSNQSKTFDLELPMLDHKIDVLYQPETTNEVLDAFERILVKDISRDFQHSRTYEGRDKNTNELIIAGSNHYLAFKGYSLGSIQLQASGKIPTYKGMKWTAVDNPKQK